MGSMAHCRIFESGQSAAILFGVLDTRGRLREMRIAQILAFVQNAKWVLSSNDVLHTLINRKCG